VTVEPKRAAEILRQRHMETPSVTVSEACLIGALAIEAMEADREERHAKPLGYTGSTHDLPAYWKIQTARSAAWCAYLAAAHPEKKHDR
jgi:hypothetical protein